MVSAFFLDRHADGFDSALKAAESAAQSAHAARGGSETAFVWVDAPCQEGFAKALGVSDLSVRFTHFIIFSPFFIFYFRRSFCVGACFSACSRFVV